MWIVSRDGKEMKPNGGKVCHILKRDSQRHSSLLKRTLLSRATKAFITWTRRFTEIFALVAICSSAAHAGGYPDRTIRLVIPFAAGGGATFISQLLNPSLQAT